MNKKSGVTPTKSSQLLVPSIIVGIIAVVLITWMMYNWTMSTFGEFDLISILITFGLDAFVFVLCIAIGLGIKW
jgi:hypothetical protein